MSLYIKILLLYTLIINIALFFTMGFDKHCAVKEKRRIPEATLFIMALLGGSIGGFLSMKLFHHKTKKWYFYVIFVLALFFQIILWILLFSKSKTFLLLPEATSSYIMTWI